MVLKFISASFDILLILFENVPPATHNLSCSVFFRNVIFFFFALIKEYCPLQKNYISYPKHKFGQEISSAIDFS